MKLIVGLGNPGKMYQSTRHNMGFLVLDALADKLGVDIDKHDFSGIYARFKFQNEDIYFLKPQTFMNLSGKSVQEIISYFKLSIDDILVVFDDLALETGKIRMRLSGSSGGHNGMKNIIDVLKTNEIKRVRIGIGAPKYNCVDYVLGKISGDEQILIMQAVDKAVEAIIDYLKYDFHYAMSKYN